MRKSQQSEGNQTASWIFYGALAIIALFAVYALFLNDRGIIFESRQILIESSRSHRSLH